MHNWPKAKAKCKIIKFIATIDLKYLKESNVHLDILIYINISTIILN